MSGDTIASKTRVVELRRLVSKLIPHLEWRCNGLGVLQAYVSEGEVEDTRVHIWHPDLEKPGIEDSGKLHDHRFTLRSTVLHGEIFHDEFRMTEHPEGQYQMFPVVHARKALRETKTFDGTVTADPERYNANIVSWGFSEGEVYTFRRGAFHGTRVNGLVVTLVTKTEQLAVPARILAPAGSTPVHAFADPLPRRKWQQYLDKAQLVLSMEG